MRPNGIPILSSTSPLESSIPLQMKHFLNSVQVVLGKYETSHNFPFLGSLQ